MPGLIAELQRRNVLRVAILYVIVSWVALQVADVGVSLLGLPLWSGRLVALLLAVGFPVALAFAWIYELTPDGLRRERDVPAAASITQQTGRRINWLIGAVGVLAIAAIVADRLLPRAAAPAPVATVAPATPTTTAAASHASVPSIAVLPFVNMSEDAANVYFSEGLSEELINALARLPDLRVIGRTSSFQFQGKPQDVRVIGARLGVANVLEGSVRTAGERMRVNAQLVSTRDGSELWSNSYERNAGDVFAIQDDIAADVVKALRVKLLQRPTSARSAAAGGQAYTLVLKAHYFLLRSTREDLQKAKALYSEAIRLAPTYAKAWVGLAGVYYAQTSYDHLPVATGLKAMRAATQKALALDPDFPAAHHMMAAIQMSYDWNWAAAEQSINRAHVLAPGDPSILRQAGTLDMTLGRFDEAIDLYRQSLDLDPLAATTLNNLAIAQYYDGDLTAAEDSIHKLLELAPDSDGASYFLGLVALARAQPQAAMTAFAHEPGEVWRLQGEALAAHALGQAAASDAAMTALEARYADDSAFQIAEAHAFRGEKTAALAWLDRAYAQRDGGLSELKGDPLLRNLENDPRFNAFLARMHLQ